MEGGYGHDARYRWTRGLSMHEVSQLGLAELISMRGTEGSADRHVWNRGLIVMFMGLFH